MVFSHAFQTDFPEATGDAEHARRAFVGALGDLGSFYHNRYNEGQQEVLVVIAAEEDNLLSALRLARAGGWWGDAIAAMQGLRILYQAIGRRATWRRLVEDVMLDLVDPATDEPLSGREDVWIIATDYRARLASEERRWSEVERLQRARVDWSRKSAEPALAVNPKNWNKVHRLAIRNLASCLHELAESSTGAESGDLRRDFSRGVAARKRRGRCSPGSHLRLQSWACLQECLRAIRS